MNIIIPARMGSKGLPFKNRQLFRATADTIPVEQKKKVWVTTDDPEIIRLTAEYGFNLIVRPSDLASDDANIRDVMVHAVEVIELPAAADVVMLYLTYPQRAWNEIMNAFEYFQKFSEWDATDSLLCRKQLATSPYLMMLESGWNKVYGTQLIEHDLYRRQDYPVCFEISHYISIFKVAALQKLNKNMYCPSTIFYPISDVIDVDTQKDLDLVRS